MSPNKITIAEINMSGTVAKIFHEDGYFIGDVRKREGFWEAKGPGGVLLVERVPHTLIGAPNMRFQGNRKPQTHVTLGEVIKRVRESVLGVRAPAPAAA